MTGHTDTFSTTERFAIDAIANLHDQLREAAGNTRTRFCAHGAEDMLDVCRTLLAAMDTIRADDRLLTEIGRRQLVKLNACGPVGGVGEDELVAFYRNPENLRAAGKVVLQECDVNLSGWLAQCRAMLDAQGRPLH